MQTSEQDKLKLVLVMNVFHAYNCISIIKFNTNQWAFSAFASIFFTFLLPYVFIRGANAKHNCSIEEKQRKTLSAQY